MAERRGIHRVLRGRAFQLLPAVVALDVTLGRMPFGYGCAVLVAIGAAFAVGIFDLTRPQR